MQIEDSIAQYLNLASDRSERYLALRREIHQYGWFMP